MKIRILSPCYVAGKAYKKGDVIDVDERHTRDVLGLKRAEKVVEEKKPVDEKKSEGAGATTDGGSEKKKNKGGNVDAKE